MRRRHIRPSEMRPRVTTRLFPLLKTLKGEAAFDMENLFKTRNEGDGTKLTSRFKFPFKAGMESSHTPVTDAMGIIHS